MELNSDITQAIFALGNVEAARLYTINQVAAILSVSTKTVRRWIDSGKLIAVRPGPRSMRIPGHVVSQLLEQNNGVEESR